MSEHCPTCGQPVTVVTNGEGTAHYAPAAQQERDHYRAALEGARDALADPNALAEDTDSPANMAFALVNHALSDASELSSKRSDPTASRKGRSL